MKKIIFYLPDKSVVVRTPALKSRRLGETEEQWLNRIANRNPRSASYDIVDEQELPATREDRGAWEGEKDTDITVNQVKAQELRDERERVAKIRQETLDLAEQSLIDKGEISAKEIA